MGNGTSKVMEEKRNKGYTHTHKHTSMQDDEEMLKLSDTGIHMF